MAFQEITNWNSRYEAIERNREKDKGSCTSYPRGRMSKRDTPPDFSETTI
jgi:hypothetical protein